MLVFRIGTRASVKGRESQSSVYTSIVASRSSRRYAQGPMAMDRDENIERVAIVEKNFMFSSFFKVVRGRGVGWFTKLITACVALLPSGSK